MIFDSGKDMMNELKKCDLYCIEKMMYVFLYNEAGAVCMYRIDHEEAIKLEAEAKEKDEYWAAFLGFGGQIFDDPSDKINPPNPGFSNIEFCNDVCHYDWIPTKDVPLYLEFQADIEKDELFQYDCPKCGKHIDGNVSYSKYGWKTTCSNCHEEYYVSLPKGKFVIAFVDDRDPEQDSHHFSENFLGKDIRVFYAFKTASEFIDGWKRISEDPDGMWYWCLYDPCETRDPQKMECFCSGACDPDDINYFPLFQPLAEGMKKEGKLLGRKEFIKYITENYTVSPEAIRLIDNILSYIELQGLDLDQQHDIAGALLDGTIGLTKGEICLLSL